MRFCCSDKAYTSFSSCVIFSRNTGLVGLADSEVINSLRCSIKDRMGSARRRRACKRLLREGMALAEDMVACGKRSVNRWW